MGFPSTLGDPMPSASVRKVLRDTAGPDRKTKRPWSAGLAGRRAGGFYRI